MRYADLDDKILTYDNEQTDAINKNATDIEQNRINTEAEFISLSDEIELTNSQINALKKDYIVDYGSNANGNWEKWASGKLVQKSKITITTGTTESFGSLYRSNSTTTIEFPIPFIDTPELYPNNNGPGAFENIVQSLDKDSFGLRLIHVFNQKVDTPISYIAIGRWK